MDVDTVRTLFKVMDSQLQNEPYALDCLDKTIEFVEAHPDSQTIKLHLDEYTKMSNNAFTKQGNNIGNPKAAVFLDHMRRIFSLAHKLQLKQEKKEMQENEMATSASLQNKEYMDTSTPSATEEDGFIFPKNSRKKARVLISPTELVTENKFEPLSKRPFSGPKESSKKAQNLEKKETRVPPFFIQTPEDSSELIGRIHTAIGEPITAKLVGANCKVQPISQDQHSKIKRMLLDEKYAFHTFSSAKDKPITFVIRGIPPEKREEEVIEEIKKNGHTARSAKQIVSRRTKKPLPLYVITADNTPENEDIMKNFSILFFMKIQVEKLKKKGSWATQCFNCQIFFHTAHSCYRPPRCMKCGDMHPTNSCIRKKEDEGDISCANCQENHVSIFKGCKAYPKPGKAKTLFRAKGTTAQEIPKTNAVNTTSGLPIGGRRSYAKVADPERSQGQGEMSPLLEDVRNLASLLKNKRLLSFINTFQDSAEQLKQTTDPENRKTKLEELTKTLVKLFD